jgi:hypothetical protein
MEGHGIVHANRVACAERIGCRTVWMIFGMEGEFRSGVRLGRESHIGH